MLFRSYAISLLFFLFSLPNPKQSQEKGQGAIPALFLCLREGDGCMLKSGGRLYVECGHLGSLSVPAIKSCWSCHKINDNPQSWTFIVSKSEQLQDYSGDSIKTRIEDNLKSGGVNADEVCALLDKYSGYFDVCDDILKVFAKQPVEPAEKQIVTNTVILDVIQQTVLNAVYSMDSDKDRKSVV